ncbi:glycoside hydrolase family 172 protein [Paramicrobacterium fandaimingii]|uniref:glycoside hydrolase family 172 protein n=1 Tax=Paramicrobacterium fandaimingii TaxID=2708079 RepID=UPI001423919C|nr:glycoside hydrolase family 172 protein [Microbacterium fandaimingii]
MQGTESQDHQAQHPGGVEGLASIRNTVTRSISPENRDGAPSGGGSAIEGTGANFARELGPGWKVSPNIVVEPGTTAEIADVNGAGTIRHIWMTTGHEAWREMVLRMYWDSDQQPAVETPLGDFFGQGWAQYAHLSSIPVTVAPNGGLNSYWPMPFHSRARVTVENLSDTPQNLYYEITYDEGRPPGSNGWFHAHWHRSNPLTSGAEHVLLDDVEGRGHYVGTYLAWGVTSRGWWGEGEMKFFMDSDTAYPTINGTGTEDYFGGAWDFNVPGEGYALYSTPYLGLHQVIRPDGLYESQQRFGMYRWHVLDPIRFAERLRVQVQALGWRSRRRYLQRHDDIASTAFFYLDRTSTSRPQLPNVDELEPL